MEEQPLPLYVKNLFNYDHNTIIQSYKFSELNENNHTNLRKVRNHFKQVKSAHELASKAIQARSGLLTEKQEYLKGDVKNLESTVDDVAETMKYLSDKFAEVKDKQDELTRKVQRAFCHVRSYKNISGAELQFDTDLQEIKRKVRYFSIEVETINKKCIVVEKQNDLYSFDSEKCKLQECQVNLVKENLSFMGIDIQKLLDDISDIKEVIEKDEQLCKVV